MLNDPTIDHQQQQQQSCLTTALVSDSIVQQTQLQPPLPPTTAATNTTTTTTTTTMSLEHGRLSQHGVYQRPCVALSQGIMSVYRLINNKYSVERRRRQPGPKYNDGYDDRHGHYVAYTGEEIWGRYTVQGVLGRGSFGTVLKCFDEKHQEQVAAKVIRNGEYFYEQGLMEVDIVARLNGIPALENLVVRLGKVFVWKSHLVLVFEMLSMNLFQLIQRTNYNGVSLDLTRKFAYQLVLVLKQLEEHNPPIIHCDVKPENVVLRDPSRSSIRLVDFGSACYLRQGAKLFRYVQSRFYRSVEVILELGYDTAIDRWSLGCMLVELHTGVPLFAGKNEVDQIARFTGVLGPVPDEMIERSHRKDVFFYDYRQSQQETLPRQWTAVDEGSTMTNDAQRPEPTTSPSPVIAAEVLHSLSMTSSISAVTAVSGGVAAAAVAARPSAVHSDTVTTTAAGTAPCSLSQQQQQQQQKQHSQPVSAALEGRQLYRNPSIIQSGGGSTNNANSIHSAVAVPALRRPRTAITMAPSSKKDGRGHMTTEGGGGLISAATRRSTQNAVKKQPPSKPRVSTSAMNVVSLTAFSSSRHSTGSRPLALTPVSRLAISSNSHTHTDGPPPPSTKVGRAGMPQSATATGEQQQTSPPLPKSPFVLRAPPTPDQCQSLEEIIGVYTGGPRGCRRGQVGHGVADYKIFLDFIKRLLCYDPRRRMSCTEALQHPFLSELETQKQWRCLSAGGAS